MRITMSNPNVNDCLMRCDDESACVAVVLHLQDGGKVGSCSLRKGDATVGNSMRALVRTRTSSEDALPV
jgi:hypothetical protein